MEKHTNMARATNCVEVTEQGGLLGMEKAAEHIEDKHVTPEGTEQVIKDDQGESSAREMLNLGITGLGEDEKQVIIRNKNPAFDKIPYDIAHALFELLDLGSATCLGLTCPALYGHLKSFHAAPIPLSYKEDKTLAVSPYLGNTIESWKGLVQYRFCTWDKLLKFLKVEVYGPDDIATPDASDADKVNAHYAALRYRLLDYDYANRYVWRYRSDRPDVQEYVKVARLPNPLGMGLDWYAAAFEAIKKSLSTLDNVQEWQASWEGAMVFREHLDHWSKVRRQYELEPLIVLNEETCDCQVCMGVFDGVLRKSKTEWLDEIYYSLTMNSAGVPPTT